MKGFALGLTLKQIDRYLCFSRVALSAHQIELLSTEAKGNSEIAFSATVCSVVMV